jgi:hypothetical protein
MAPHDGAGVSGKIRNLFYTGPLRFRSAGERVLSDWICGGWLDEEFLIMRK